MGSESCLGHYHPSVPVNPLNRVQKQLVNQCHPGQGQVVSGSGHCPSPPGCPASPALLPGLAGRAPSARTGTILQDVLAGPGTVTCSAREPGRKEPQNSCGAALAGGGGGQCTPTPCACPGVRVSHVPVPVHRLSVYPCTPAHLHTHTCAPRYPLHPSSSHHPALPCPPSPTRLCQGRVTLCWHGCPC